MNEKDFNFKVALTLALAVLTSWEEDDRREPGRKIIRSWKGFKFDVLDELEERGFIRAAVGTRSMQITEAGKKIGENLSAQFSHAFAIWEAIQVMKRREEAVAEEGR
jgi:hypothetical protein